MKARRRRCSKKKQVLKGISVYFDCHNPDKLHHWIEVWRLGATFYAVSSALEILRALGLSAYPFLPQKLPDVAVINLPEIEKGGDSRLDAEEEQGVLLKNATQKIAIISTMIGHGNIIVTDIDDYDGVVGQLSQLEFPWETRDDLLIKAAQEIEHYMAAVADWAHRRGLEENRRSLFVPPPEWDDE